MNFLFRIEGMHCSSCVEKIKSALSPHFKLINVSLHPPLLELEATEAPQLETLNQHLSRVGKYHLQPVSNTESSSENSLTSYYPIFLITTYIFGVALINNIRTDGIYWFGWMQQFMAGFFLVFSAFKLLNLRGFAEGYATYDLLAKRWFTYGYIYPFIELSLGILYLTNSFLLVAPLITIIVMGFSSLGVINSLLKKQKFQCACLGTMLKVPLSKITLIEDLTMVVMAACMLAM
jgi:cation transport ATPase